MKVAVAGPDYAPQVASTRPSTDSVHFGSFTNLKLTAEKLVKEQASVKTDLELAHTKLRKATEQIHVLEAKLQESVNENAKLKSLCDQLSEAVNDIADQNHTAEEDKKLVEKKLLENAQVLGNLESQLNQLSAKLQCADNAIKVGKQEMLKLRLEKKEEEKRFRHELCTADEVLKGKDSTIKELEDTIEQSKQHVQTLNSQLLDLQHALIVKEETFKQLSVTKNDMEIENGIIRCKNQDLKQQIERSCMEIKNLEETIQNLMSQIAQLEKESLNITNHVLNLIYSFEKCYDLMQQEKDLAVKRIQGKAEQLQHQLLIAMEETSSLKLHNEQHNIRIVELQKAQEFVMVQHADECRLTEDKVRRLECEIDGLLTRKNELERLVTELEDRVKHLSEASNHAENQVKELLVKNSMLDSENHNLQCKMQLVLQEKTEEKEALSNEIEKHKKHADSLANQISELRCILDEKEKLVISFTFREQQLEEQKSEIQASLTAAECKLTEAKKQYDMMFEGKQLELSKHLKELSQKNDQAINEIRKKYEAEKEEIANQEKEKANKLIKEMERNCEEKITKDREEAERCLMHVKEENKEMILKIKQDHEQKEICILAHHSEELQRFQFQAENELRESLSSLRKEHEIQMKSLKMLYEDEQRKLQEDLEIQKSKEEKQRRLLQLQWKVMGENQQNNQEANSKKEYSVSSIKMRDPYSVKGHEIVLPTPESERKEMNLSEYLQTPMANLLKKVNDRKSVPKHRKVTRHEYEVETSNGRTITKRRRTKSTVMFGDPTSHKTMHMKTPSSNIDAAKKTKVTSRPHSHPASIGDLFSEGSLNPYTDDPYAFG
ncbi:hypothetical protein HPP92_004286 [Vanilla planifolia]|uniref:Synaptonemal complex protein 1 n=1 Tax=Vanilla planifolia TaxID=51239 RepID=A0A835RW18_VANPL|nr:hypothetical protein HPP92_004286 [Vanilla planifolia]